LFTVHGKLAFDIIKNGYWLKSYFKLALLNWL
jgi:hypothetical protein